MAEGEDKDDKTEEASAHKLAEAAKKGDQARTPDLPSSLSLIFVCLSIAFAGPMMAESLLETLLPLVDHPHAFMSSLNGDGGLAIGQTILLATLPIMIAILSAALVGGLLGHVLQGGIIVAPDKLKPDFSKLDPIKGLGRLFGIDALMQFAKTFVKIIVTVVISFSILKDKLMVLPSLTGMAPLAWLKVFMELFLALALAVCVFLLAGAGLDYLWQRFRFLERMKMSKQEQKDEYKQMEGDPHVKGKLKAIRQEKSRRRMMANVAQATVVITNPTHYAVALKYEADGVGAPVCVAKGLDAIALKIREEAAKHKITIVEDPPLARALYASVEIDEVIDEMHFLAVSKIIGFVLQKQKRGF